MRFCTILFLSLTSVLSLYSQDSIEDALLTNNKISITLEDALIMAFDNDKTLKQAEYDVRIAQVQKSASFSDLFMPSLSISGGLNIAESKEYIVKIGRAHV